MGSSPETYFQSFVPVVVRNLKQNGTVLTYLSLALKWISNVASDGHGAIVWNASIAFNTLEKKR